MTSGSFLMGGSGGGDGAGGTEGTDLFLPVPNGPVPNGHGLADANNRKRK